MSDHSPAATTAAGEEDHWPSFDITPKAYEEAVAVIAKSMNLNLVGWEVKHLDPIQGLDGTYIMDVTARFQLAGMDFLILFECKRPQDRQTVRCPGAAHQAPIHGRPEGRPGGRHRIPERCPRIRQSPRHRLRPPNRQRVDVPYAPHHSYHPAPSSPAPTPATP